MSAHTYPSQRLKPPSPQVLASGLYIILYGMINCQLISGNPSRFYLLVTFVLTHLLTSCMQIRNKHDHAYTSQAEMGSLINIRRDNNGSGRA